MSLEQAESKLMAMEISITTKQNSTEFPQKTKNNATIYMNHYPLLTLGEIKQCGEFGTQGM